MITLEIVESRVRRAVTTEDYVALQAFGEEVNTVQIRKEREKFIGVINGEIISHALAHNRPEIVDFCITYHDRGIQETLVILSRAYLLSKNDSWLDAIINLSQRFERKNHQSAFYAQFTRDLIRTGMKERNPSLISQGIQMVHRIGFRKYRSEIIIEIFPLLIEWAVQRNDKEILSSNLQFLGDIGDISKRSFLHCELIKAIISIGVVTSHVPALIEGIRYTTTIQQKTKRHACINAAFETIMNSALGTLFTDIPGIMSHFSDLPKTAQQEILIALIGQKLEHVNNQEDIVALICDLEKGLPFAIPCLTLKLLEKAENSGRRRFYDEALKLKNKWYPSDAFALKNFIRAGMAIAARHGDMEILRALVPDVERSLDKENCARILLQFSRVMIAKDAFYPAVEMFTRIPLRNEFTSQTLECSVHLIKSGILRDDLNFVIGRILKSRDLNTCDSIIWSVVREIEKEWPFNIFIARSDSLKTLVRLHSTPDQIILEIITGLVERGFITQHDPNFLIKLAEGIDEQSERERVISSIVINIAKTGVATRNRDFLQRAVGLSCQIDSVTVRSQALSTTIDEAAKLAAEQGDLNLLQRMKEWSISLLDKSSADFAITNIISGVIGYGLASRSIPALEEAYTITFVIHNSSLRLQQVEEIAESFGRLGCILLSEWDGEDAQYLIKSVIHPYCRSLELLQKNLKNQHFILKISGFIDIIQDYAIHNNRIAYAIPLSLFTLAIKDPLERDAMLRRIITNMNSSYDSADSSDPYEIMACLLQSDRGMRSVPFVMELTNRLIYQISNPAVRLSELCALAMAYHMIENDDAARAILSEIRSSIDSLPDTFQRVAAHAEIAAISAPFAREIAEDSLEYAIEYISSIDENQRSPVGEQIVRAIVRLNHAGVKSATIRRAMEITKEIKDLLHYVNALIVLLRMAHITPTEQGKIVSLIEKILPQVTSPYDKAQRYLAIVPLIEELEAGDRPLRILEIVQSLAKSITIPFISGLIWRRIIQRYLMLSSRRADFSLRQKAVQMASEIEDVTIRTQLLADLGIPDLHQRYTPFKKILASAKKISCDELNLHQISMLDHAVQQIKDRGEKATYYCELAVLFRNADLNAMSERMLKAALTEAGIVRPLTRRAHIFCNIALKVYATGNEKRGKEIYDLAIEAATNIRQYSLRDKVFEDLGMAMNVVQGL